MDETGEVGQAAQKNMRKSLKKQMLRGGGSQVWAERQLRGVILTF